MAINRGVLGSQTGSMGGITASNWKGRNVYKQKVPATNSSNSPAQAAQRRKFAVIAALAGQLGPAIRIGYRVAAATTTEQNVFVTRNIGAVTDDGTVATVNLGMLEVSSGTVARMIGMQAIYTAATGGLSLDFEDNSNGGDALPSDIAVAIAVDKSTGKAYPFDTTHVRAEGAITSIVLPAGLVPANVQVYGFFKRATSTSTSPSNTVAATV